MKRILWHLTLASALSLLIYLLLTLAFAAFSGAFKNPEASIPLAAALVIYFTTNLAFAGILLIFRKLRSGDAEREIWEDYRDDDTYHSPFDDLRRCLPRERRLLVTLGVMTLICFVLRFSDTLLFDRMTYSAVTTPFFALMVWDSPIPIPFVGFLLSYLCNAGAYLALLLFARRRKYLYWNTDAKH